MGTRFLLYMVTGLVLEITFYAVRVFLTVKPRDMRLPANTFLWMYPVYGSIVFTFEPLHNAIRDLPFWGRGAIYIVGFYCAEYLLGWSLKKATGKVPWDYSYSRFHIHGIIRLDYIPFWFAFGMLLERMHDTFLVVGPVLKQALLHTA